MEFIMQPYGVYVQVDDQSRIIAVNSDAFLYSLDGWVKIDEGYGDKYHHAQGNFFDHPIRDERGICRYKLVDGVPEERTQTEMDGDWVPPAPPAPSPDARITAIEETLAAYEAAYAEGVNEA